MTKYFAILKDSIREALDSKILYVMLVMSALVIFAAFALSFQPLPAEKTFAKFFWGKKAGKDVPPLFATIHAAKPRDAEAQKDLFLRAVASYPFRLVKVDSQGETDNDPLGTYRLTIAKTPLPKGGFIFAQGADAADDAKVIKSLFQEAERDGCFAIGGVEAIPIDDPKTETARYRLTAQGAAKTKRVWATDTSWMFGSIPLAVFSGGPLGIQLALLTFFILSSGAIVTVCIGIVVTSFFFPNMLRKGTVDLLLVKRIQRWVLILYKFVGGLTFMFLTSAVTITGYWLALGIRTGIWANGLLLLIFTLTFFFAILYSISTFAAVVTRSTVVSIMVALLAYAALGTFDWAHTIFERMVKDEANVEIQKEQKRELAKLTGEVQPNPKAEHAAVTKWADSYWVLTFRVLNEVLPRTGDLNALNRSIMEADLTSGDLTKVFEGEGEDRNWWLMALVSTAWIAFFLGLSIAWFTFNDY